MIQDCMQKLRKDSLSINTLKKGTIKKMAIKHMREQKGIGKDKFPETIIYAINTLNTYKTTYKESINKNKKKHIQQGNENKNENTQELPNDMEKKYTFSTIEANY